MFVHYGLSVLLLLFLRPLAHRLLNVRGRRASRPLYFALYFFPVLALIHALMAGLICKLHETPWKRLLAGHRGPFERKKAPLPPSLSQLIIVARRQNELVVDEEALKSCRSR